MAKPEETDCLSTQESRSEMIAISYLSENYIYNFKQSGPDNRENDRFKNTIKSIGKI